jgi:predicted ATPase
MSAADQPQSVEPSRVPFLHRVVIQDYKSIGHCEVDLGPLTLLVGRNGSGKSNFLDALRFVADSLRTSLDQAVRSRVSFDDIRHQRSELAVLIDLNFSLPDQSTANYKFLILSFSSRSFNVNSEHLRITAESGELLAYYRVQSGKVTKSSIENPPAAQADRLYLVSASGLPEFRRAYDALTAMTFYDFNPEAMRSIQAPDIGESLWRDGGNVASVVARLKDEQPELLDRITQYIGAIVPGVEKIESISLGPSETLKFTQMAGDPPAPHEFYLWNMSDGTLRALGSLVAAFQFAGREKMVGLVAIEEPENSLHPAAAAVLMDAFQEAATRTQILITSHSPDLLDKVDLDTDSLLAVALRDGVTNIAPIDKASLSVIRRQLYTPGELLRMDQLEPDQEDLARQNPSTPRSEKKG